MLISKLPNVCKFHKESAEILTKFVRSFTKFDIFVLNMLTNLLAKRLLVISFFSDWSGAKSANLVDLKKVVSKRYPRIARSFPRNARNYKTHAWSQRSLALALSVSLLPHHSRQDAHRGAREEPHPLVPMLALAQLSKYLTLKGSFSARIRRFSWRFLSEFHEIL